MIFYFGIFDEEEDLMFAIKLGLFSIGTIILPTLVWSNQPIKLITLAGLNLVEQAINPIEPVSEPPSSSNIHAKPIFIQCVKIFIPHDIFQQHLLKTFFQPEIGEMEIDETPTQIRIQNLCITRWFVIE
jgi:hypothetical protein